VCPGSLRARRRSQSNRHIHPEFDPLHRKPGWTKPTLVWNHSYERQRTVKKCWELK